jgi:hypothetical protein
MNRFRPHANTAYEPLELTTAASTNGDIVSRRHPNLHVGTWARILPLIAITVTTACAVTLLALRLSYWKDNLGFYNIIATQRVAVQVFIHILSSLLAVLWTYSVCSTINKLTRSYFARRIVSLNTLRLWTVISQARLEWNLSAFGVFASLSFYGITVLGAWLWTGALTPQLTTFSGDGHGYLPKTGDGAYPFLHYRLDTDAFYFDCFTLNQANGSFTNCPGVYKSGELLTAASSATTIDGSPRNHSKLDSTDYRYVTCSLSRLSLTLACRYIGRSYGAGSSVGLTIGSINNPTLQGYNYTEKGYITTVECEYNSSSLWQIYAMDGCDTEATSLPCLYMTEGCFPNSDFNDPQSGFPCSPDYYSQTAFGSTGDAIVSMGATNSDNLTEYYVSIAAGSMYEQLDKLQCQFVFKPTLFDVEVSTINSTIQVKPTQEKQVADIEPKGLLRSKLMDAINTITMVQTSLYVSTAGVALMNNVRNYVSRSSGLQPSVDDATPDDIIGAVEDSMQIMADDILESFAAASLTQPDATTREIVQFTAFGYAIGETPFIIAVVVYQVLAMLFIIAATVATGFWSETPIFDFSEIGSMAAATSLGAKVSGDTMTTALRSWNGDSDHAALNSVTAQLHQAERPLVILSSHG